MRSKDDDGLNDYIEQLERYFLELKASNTLNLIMKLDEMNGTIVDDLDKVINGEAIEHRMIEGELVEVSNLRVLHESSQNKTFERVMSLYSKLKDLKAVSDMVTSMIPEVIDGEGEEDVKVSIPKGTNPFEAIVKQKAGKK